MISRTPFITFEGTDGAGKSTQIKLLKEWLESQGVPVVLTREPGGCQMAESIRELVLSNKSDLGSRGELLLYLAARAENVRQVILPALEKGHWVISDRYSDSTFAYQGYGRELDLAELMELNRIATGGVSPLKTILLDIDVTLGKQRVLAGRADLDRLELSSLEFFERVRHGYLKMADHDPRRFVVIDAQKSVEEIQEKIRKAITPFLH